MPNEESIKNTQYHEIVALAVLVSRRQLQMMCRCAVYITCTVCRHAISHVQSVRIISVQQGIVYAFQCIFANLLAQDVPMPTLDFLYILRLNCGRDILPDWMPSAKYGDSGKMAIYSINKSKRQQQVSSTIFIDFSKLPFLIR